MVRRIEELQARIAEHKARLQSTGALSDPGKSEAQMLGVMDELAFIVAGQFEEISKLKRRIRELEKK
jgi:uncharacterized coiled-coil protein SlyX